MGWICIVGSLVLVGLGVFGILDQPAEPVWVVASALVGFGGGAVLMAYGLHRVGPPPGTVPRSRRRAAAVRPGEAGYEVMAGYDRGSSGSEDPSRSTSCT